MLYGFVMWTMTIAYYEMLLITRDVAMIAPRKGPTIRDKFDVMKFTK